MENKNTTCIICGSQEHRLLYQPLAIAQCLGCGLVCRLCHDVGTDYYQDLDKYRALVEDPVRTAARKRDSSLRFSVCSPFLPATGKLLDIGSHDGITMLEAQQRGLQAFGCEPNAQARSVAQSRGLSVAAGGLDQAFSQLQGNAPYEVVTMFHVLEHLDDPCAALNKIKSLLAKDGCLILEVPDFDAPISRAFGWDQMRVTKEHLYYFTAGTLQRLLEKQGYTVELIRRKCWDGMNRPCSENLLRLPVATRLYMLMRLAKKACRRLLHAPAPNRTTFDDNSELWNAGKPMQEKRYFFAKQCGWLVYHLNRGDDLIAVCKA